MKACDASEIADVTAALLKVRKPNQTLISRQVLFEEIKANSGAYHRLGNKSDICIKRAITMVMDSWYSHWNQEGGCYRHSWVWDLAAPLVEAVSCV